MGNAMACCGKTDSDPNNINTGGFGVGTTGDKKGSHLNIVLVVKIQAAIRGYLDRKRVKRIKNQGGRAMMH